MWSDEGLTWNAVTEAVEPIIHLETHTDRNKLEKQIRSYFSKGAKNLEFSSKSFEEVVNEYADNIYGSLFASLGDREWLQQADFLLVFDAAIKDNFPTPLVRSIPQINFERIVLEASDRAYDNERYCMSRWEIIQNCIQGKLTQKKVRECLDEARAAIVQQGVDNITDFVSAWTYTTVELLTPKCQGDPSMGLPAEVAVQLFDALIQDAGLPSHLVEAEGMPQAGWPVIHQCVAQAYAPYAGLAQDQTWQTPQPMFGKGVGKGGKFGGKGGFAYAPF